MAVTLTTPNTLLGRFQPGSTAARVASNMATVVLGTLFIAACAKINVPTWPVPVTLQGLGIAIIAASFGLRIGVATVALYLLEGLMGLPVFAGPLSGPAYLLGSTGGFLSGFLVLAAIVGYAADRGASARPFTLFAAMVIGDAVMMALGFGWLIAMSGQAVWIDQSNVLASAWARGVEPFIVWDILKMALAALTVSGAWGLVARR